MKRTNNQSIWDAKRLIQEYVKLANLISHYKEKSFDDIAWSYQIRVKRIASALSAFMGLKDTNENPLDLILFVFDGWYFDNLFDHSPIIENDKVKLQTMVKETMNNDKEYEDLMRTFEERPHDRAQMLRFFLDFRVETERLLSHFEGVLQANLGGILAYHSIRGQYFPTLREYNDKIDEMIVILLGDKFKQSFSEEDLITNYGYPKETYDELFEWDCDNM